VKSFFFKAYSQNQKLRSTVSNCHCTYHVIEQQAVKTDEDGEIEESEALNEFASAWASILCDPENERIFPHWAFSIKCTGTY